MILCPNNKSEAPFKVVVVKTQIMSDFHEIFTACKSASFQFAHRFLHSSGIPSQFFGCISGYVAVITIRQKETAMSEPTY
jgi:hypothetical protein